MSIMPPLPTRLVSNFSFRIYTKKAWESYIFARPDAQASHASKSRTRNMQRPTHIWQHPLLHYGTMGELSLYAGIYCGFSWLGYWIASSSVNQSVSKRLFQYICPPVRLSARLPFRHCKDNQNLALWVWFSREKVEYDAKKCRFRKILRKVE